MKLLTEPRKLKSNSISTHVNSSIRVVGACGELSQFGYWATLTSSCSYCWLCDL